ncbi:aspartic [Cyanidiococcus yangmingshanensis]|uniref:Aspartic n=1 Tax=Cyanidiococcus yangmingshanensis TaxID=2690220 RepID=A0A7J7IR29_9RHOD|nr:aspartic [Cyanidiococcus yangmingshanensis]
MYATTIEIDGRPYAVSVDTGSSSLAVITSNCASCPTGKRRVPIEADRVLRCGRRTVPLGNPPETFECESDRHGSCDGRGNCVYHIRYGDGTTFNGRYVVGMVGAAGRAAPMVFGGIETANGPNGDVFGNGIEGMLGLAYPGLSCNPLCTTPFFETLLQHGAVPANMFSLCVSDQQGRLVLGALDPQMDPEQIVWTPIVHDLFYDIELDHVYIDGHDAKIISRHSAFVDSGTTLIAFSSATFGTFRDYLREHYCHIPYVCPTDPQSTSILDHAACASYTEEHLAQFPNLTFVLAGAGNLTIRPDQYFVRVERPSEPTFYCLGIIEEPLLGPGYGVEAVLGLVWLRNYMTVYDRSRRRIGFQSARGCTPVSGDTDSNSPATYSEAGHGAGSQSPATVPAHPDGLSSIHDFVRKWINVFLAITIPTLLVSLLIWIVCWCYRKRHRERSSIRDPESTQTIVHLQAGSDTSNSFQ